MITLPLCAINFCSSRSCAANRSPGYFKYKTWRSLFVNQERILSAMSYGLLNIFRLLFGGQLLVGKFFTHTAFVLVPSCSHAEYYDFESRCQSISTFWHANSAPLFFLCLFIFVLALYPKSHRSWEFEKSFLNFNWNIHVLNSYRIFTDLIKNLLDSMSYTEVIFSSLNGLQEIGVLNEETATSKILSNVHFRVCQRCWVTEWYIIKYSGPYSIPRNLCSHRYSRNMPQLNINLFTKANVEVKISWRTYKT